MKAVAVAAAVRAVVVAVKAVVVAVPQIWGSSKGSEREHLSPG
ncbi:hypothetical protein O7606_18270 [Micromonospora sp. WMMD882]|nr:hypothetical protein [Micromonospora sp. WMMD882]WBB78176.1 hypothetical protein O7606_18270 [Micromonospora sp. WMMD882]